MGNAANAAFWEINRRVFSACAPNVWKRGERGECGVLRNKSARFFSLRAERIERGECIRRVFFRNKSARFFSLRAERGKSGVLRNKSARFTHLSRPARQDNF